ncbi:hypothetical protein N0V93_001945 [Gnomoniopsis smithogilvyi]|uniref:Uncharacterized protein n=1 Tax=Gnomoniopsis smithogilvyi TaxID=1191159 RepID=A0A9W8Z4N4_9PEZI|nr:hypothetical protein N0V93_001945 [Gnomoniopsis smithogilvyi]
MAGKDYKVQKKAKEQQRLSVFQPAFRWGGNNASSSTGSSSKIEAKKNDRLGPNRNDRVERRQNERVDQPRKNDNRLAITEDPETRMARDAKRMTTFQPIFGSLFSSKPSKGKGHEPSQHSQARRPPASGLTSQQSQNQITSSTRYDGGNGAPGSSRGGRSGPGYQAAGLRINTQETLSSSSRRNDATTNSSGRSGRGGLAPVPEGYSPRPRSPLQRNPAISLPEDDLRPLGISNAFGTGARGKEKANAIGKGPANSPDYVSSGVSRDPRPTGQDRGLGIAMPSAPATTRNVPSIDNQKRSGADVDIDPGTKRERLGIGFRRDDRGATDQLRASEAPIRKPVVSKSEPKEDPRSQKQTGGRALDDGKLAQPPIGRSQNVPQLIVTDTSDILSSKASGRSDRPTRGQQSIGATTSNNVPAQGPDSVREASGSRLAEGPPSATKGAVRPSPRSPLDRMAQSITSISAKDTQNVSQGRLQDDLQRNTSSSHSPAQSGAPKSSLSVFPKQKSQPQHPIPESELDNVKSKGLDPLYPATGREEARKPSQIRQILELSSNRDVDSLPGNLQSDAPDSRQASHKPPFEVFNSSSARQTPQSESLKTPEKSFRDLAMSAKAQPLIEKQQSPLEPPTTRKPRLRDEATTSSNAPQNGRAVASNREDKARPLEASQSSSAGSSRPKSVKGFAEQTKETQAVKPDASRTGWASRYFETTRHDRSDNNLPKLERHLDSGKGTSSTTSSRANAPDQGRQSSETTQIDGEHSGAASFKQRVQESFGVGKESNLLKPLKSKFSGPKKQEVSHNFPHQSSQPHAGDVQAQQVDVAPGISHQREPPAGLDRPKKEYKPYSSAKKVASHDAKEEFGKSKASAVPDWLLPANSDMPSRPDRPQDELFMGISGSALRPSPMLDHTAPSKDSFSPDSRFKKSARGTNVPLPEVKTGRSDISSTRKPDEATQLPTAEQDSREYTLVTAGTPVNLRSETSRSAHPQAGPVRIVSGIIEKPKEIDIQKSGRPAKTTRPSSSEAEPNRSLAEKPDTTPVFEQKKVDTKQLDSFSSHGANPPQATVPSGRRNISRGDQRRDRRLNSTNNEAQKQAPVDESPRPILASSTAAQKDDVDRSPAVDSDKAFGSQDHLVNMSGGPALLDPENTQPRGLLGRFAGRGKPHKAPEQLNQSVATEQSPVTKESQTMRSFKSGYSGQKLPQRQDFEDAVSTVRSGHRSRKEVDAPSTQGMEPVAKDVIATSTMPRLAFTGTTTDSSPKGIVPKGIVTPPTLSRQLATERGIVDAPAPLRVGGRRPTQLEDTEPKSREGLESYQPPSAEKQTPTNGKLTDRDMLHTTRAVDSDVTSPQLPSQEDFFKQLRQSVMFRKADSPEKTDLSESSDATSKRKSRRNRNVSISGLQPMRGVMPDIPTLDTSEYLSAVDGGDSTPRPSASQTTPNSRPEASFRKSQGRDLSDEKAAKDLSIVSTDEPRIHDMMVTPVTLAGQSPAYATEQAKTRALDTGYKSQTPSATDTTVRGLEQPLALDPPPSTVSRGSGTDTPQEGRLARVPLHPAPSSAGVFRRPSFGDQEGLQQSITTHDMPLSAGKANTKVQDFFDGLFKSKESGDVASGLGSRTSPREEVAREGQDAIRTNGKSVKGLSASPQANGADRDSPFDNEVLPQSSAPFQGRTDERNFGQSEMEARSSFDWPKSQTQTAKEMPNAGSTPITPHQPVMGDTRTPSVPIDLTSKGRDLTGPLVTGNTTEDPSPYSIDVPMLFIEDVSASPMSQAEATIGQSMSTVSSKKANRHSESFKTSDLQTSSHISSRIPDSSVSMNQEEAKQMSLASSLIQDERPSQGVESSSRGFAKENAFSPVPSDVLVGNSYVQPSVINSTYVSPTKDEVGASGDEQTNVFSHLSPAFSVHEEEQKVFCSPSDFGGHLKQSIAHGGFESPLISDREIESSEGRTSPWPKVSDQRDVSATPYVSRYEPSRLRSPEERGQYLTSVYTPADNGGQTTSPQESDPDLSDHILSLYDGSDYAAPDHQSPGELTQHHSSTRELRSPIADERASVASVEPMPSDMLKSSYDTTAVLTPDVSMSNRTILEPIAASTPPATTPIHELSDPVNTETESVKPSPPRNGGIKDKLRMFFNKTDSAETGYDFQQQSAVISPVPEADHSLELSEKTTGPQGDEAISENHAPLMAESRIDDMDLKQDHTPLGGADFVSVRSEAEVSSRSTSPRAIKQDPLTEEPLSLDSIDQVPTPLQGSKQEPSPDQLMLSPEPTAGNLPMGHWDNASFVHSPREEALSPDVNHRPMANSPLLVGRDDDHFSLQSPDGMSVMDDFGTRHQQEHAVDAISRPGSHNFEDICDASSLRATPDLHENKQEGPDSPEEIHQIATSPVNHVDAFHHVAIPMEAVSETRNADEHLQLSPTTTTSYADNDHIGEHLLPEDDKNRAPQILLSERDLESPGSVQEAFETGASPMPQGGKDWAAGEIEQNQDSPEGSPQPDHIDEELFRESEPGNAIATEEPLALRGPENKPWSDETMPIGSCSPVTNNKYHGEDNVTMLGGAEPAFDTVSECDDKLEVPDSRFAAEHDESRGDFDDTVNDDLHVEDHGEKPQDLTHDDANGSAFEDHGPGEGRFDDFGGDISPIIDLQSDIEGFNGNQGGARPIEEHESHVGGFDDLPGDTLPTDDTQGSTATFDGPGLGSPSVNDVPGNDGGLDEDQIHASAFPQDTAGGIGDSIVDHYPVESSPVPGGAFGETAVDNYPVDDVESHPAAFDDAESGEHPADDFANDRLGPDSPAPEHYGAGDFDEANMHPPQSMEEHASPYGPDHDLEGVYDDAGSFHPSNDGGIPYEEPAFSDHGGEKDVGLETDQMIGDDGFHDEYPQNGPLEDHFGSGESPGGEPDFDHQANEMDFADHREGDLDDCDDQGDWNSHGQDAELDHGLGDNLDDFYGEPSREAEAEPADLIEGGPLDQGEPFAADWDGDHLDEERGLDGAEEYPMNRGDDPPMGGEAEEYMLGGGGVSPSPAMEGEDFPMGGEAEEYLMGGDGEYPMDTLEEGDDFRVEGDEELPIGDMYGAEERSMEPLEDEELPMMDGDEDLMDGHDEFAMDGQDDLPMDAQDDFQTDGQDDFPMDGQDDLPLEGEGIEGSDRGIDDFDADDQFGDGMSARDSVLDEEHGSQFDDGSAEERSLVDEGAASDLGEEDMNSEISDPFDEEPIGEFYPEDEEQAPSEGDDREIEEDLISSAAGEEDADDEEGQDIIDDLYEADVPSIPASPTSTDYGRELASPTSVPDHDEDDQDEDSIFGELVAQEDPADFENADPVRLSCLYMQDVGLMSIPSSPTVPQEGELPEQGAEEEQEEEEPREPVRFSALYRQSLDWSQALDSSMWEDSQDTLPEEDEEEILTAPLLQQAPDSSRGGSYADLRMLEADQESLTPVAASPLSPRPLETPPPDFDHENDPHGYMDFPQLVEQPGEPTKGADDDVNQRYPTSPRLQPTPPPDQDGAPSSIDSNDRRDSRGPRTFDEMNLPRRVISPPNEGEDQSGPTQGSSSTPGPTYNGRRSISQRVSGWWSGAGSSGQVQARPPPMPAPYDSRYGEPSSPI